MILNKWTGLQKDLAYIKLRGFRWVIKLISFRILDGSLMAIKEVTSRKIRIAPLHSQSEHFEKKWAFLSLLISIRTLTHSSELSDVGMSGRGISGRGERETWCFSKNVFVRNMCTWSISFEIHISLSWQRASWAMISHMLVFVVFASVFVDLIESGKSDWLIYLDERRNAECFFSTGRYFCHSTEENTRFERNVNETTCEMSGTPLSFAMLKNNLISTETLIDWLIPFRLIEQYAHDLDSGNSTTTLETLICNCTLKRLGTDCQYEIENKDWDLTRLLESQRGKSVNEYETLTSLIDGISCNGTFPRVEWRQICDGIIQCEDASDEFNCHLLDLNQCDEEDEYRCRNGMCIPREFAFDGTHDCLDSSDEQELPSLVRLFDTCPTQSLYRCDERLCRKDEFSCGDGQCVSWSSLINRKNGCRSHRHQAYRCSTAGNYNSRRNDAGICRETVEPLQPLTTTSGCLLSLRHFLAADREEILQMSMQNIVKNCSEWIEYPEKAVLSPILATFYNRTEVELISRRGMSSIRSLSRKPHRYCLRGKLTCQGQLISINKDHCMTNDEFEDLFVRYPFFPLSDLFCELVSKSNSFIVRWAFAEDLRFTDEMKNCSFSRRTTDRRLYRCENTTEFISLHRVNDGYRDCLYSKGIRERQE